LGNEDAELLEETGFPRYQFSLDHWIYNTSTANTDLTINP